jgi:hypothetical protein
MQCSSEELAEVILPCLVPSLTLWQYLSLRTEAALRSSANSGETSVGVTDMSGIDKSCGHIDIAVMLDEYAALHREIQNMCNEKLEIRPPDKPVCDLLSHDGVMKADDAAAAIDVSAAPANFARLDADDISDGPRMRDVDHAADETDATVCQTMNSSAMETEVGVASSDAGDAVSVEDLGHCSFAVSDASNVVCTAELPSTSVATAESENITAADAVAEQLIASDAVDASLPGAPDSADDDPSSNLTDELDSQSVAVVVDNDLLQVTLFVIVAVVLSNGTAGCVL